MTFQAPSASRALRAASLLVAAAALVACGGEREQRASQTAAKVNKEEITVHQINFALAQRNVPAEQAEAAGRAVLERLVEQELAVQKATELKLDRDPRVVQQLAAARREILSRAYFDKVGDGAGKPTDVQIKTYYDEHPALFAERRVYQLQELQIEADAEQQPMLREKLKAAKDMAEFVAALRATGLRFTANQVVRGAEQLPLASLPAFSQLRNGQAIVNAVPNGMQVLFLADSRSHPVDEARARPAIEQFLLNERKRKIIADDLKALRAAATVEYVGQYAQAASAPAAEATATAGATATVGSTAATAQAQAPTLEPPAPPASGGLDAATIDKGLGLARPAATAAPAAAEPAVPPPPAPASGALDASTINKGLGLTR